MAKLEYTPRLRSWAIKSYIALVVLLSYNLTTLRTITPINQIGMKN